MKKKYIIYGLIVVCLSLLFGMGVNSRLKKDVPDAVNKLVAEIPEFTLSMSGFDFEEDAEYSFSFAGRDFFVTDKEEVATAILKSEGKGNVFVVAKDGYAEVEGSVIKLAKNFKYVPWLEEISLTKADMTIFEGIATIHVETVLWVKSLIIGLAFIVFQLLVIVVTKISMSISEKLFASKCQDNAVAFKQSVITSVAVAITSIVIVFAGNKISVIALMGAYGIVEIISLGLFLRKTEKIGIEINDEGVDGNAKREV